MSHSKVRAYDSTERYASVAAGGFAGLVSTCITNPLDTLRVRLSASRAATGVSEKKLLANIKALFGQGNFIAGATQGLPMNLLCSVPSNAVYLSSYKGLNKASKTIFGKDSGVVPVVSATGAVCATNLTLAPLFTVRTRTQIENVRIADVCKEIMKADGPRGFYRGMLTNIGGRIAEEATFWYLYETAKRLTESGNLSTGSFLAGSASVLGLSSLAKMFGVALSYPYNVVMTHLREVDRVTRVHHHTKFWPTVNFVYQQDGIAGFYKGLQPHLLRSAMSKASQIYFFELGMLAFYTAYGRPEHALA